jgi:hypothetical protein
MPPPPPPPGIGRGPPPGIGRGPPPGLTPRGSRGARGVARPPPSLNKGSTVAATPPRGVGPRPPLGVDKQKATPRPPPGIVAPRGTPRPSSKPPPRPPPRPPPKPATPARPVKTVSSKMVTEKTPKVSPSKTKVVTVKKVSTPRKDPEESEFQIKQKNRKIREQIDEIKSSVRKEKKDHENEKKVMEMKIKIKEVEEKIKSLEPITSSDLQTRLAVVVNHVKGGAELKELADKIKTADETLKTLSKQEATANMLVQNSIKILTAKRQATSIAGENEDKNNVDKLRMSIASYQSAKQQFASACQSGKFSSSVILQMKRLIKKCDDLNEMEDKKSAEFVSIEKDTAKALGEAWQQTAVHKFRLDVGILAPSEGKEAKLLEMEEEVGQTMLEERETCKKKVINRLESDQQIFEHLSANYKKRTEKIQSFTVLNELSNDIKQIQRELGRYKRMYSAGKQLEKKVLHEFEKLKVGYLSEYHQDITNELKLKRKVNRRKKLLDEHLENIQNIQDQLVKSVENDWAPVLEREENTFAKLISLKQEERITTVAQLRVETAERIESFYKPKIIELAKSVEELKKSEEELEKSSDEIELALRSKLEQLNEIEQKLFKVPLMSADGDANSSNVEDLEKYQQRLRVLWRQGVVPMAVMEKFLSKLSETTEGNDMMLGMYESYNRSMDQKGVERLENTVGSIAGGTEE